MLGLMPQDLLMTDADTRLVSFLLARTARALRADNPERALGFIMTVNALLETAEPCLEVERATALVEALCAVGAAQVKRLTAIKRIRQALVDECDRCGAWPHGQGSCG
jgi:hypothetical protein